ncbi:MAG: FAD-binding oxidoreductase, partial [Betaproteobacteria bacterium]
MGASDTTGHGTRHSSLLQDLEAITGNGHVLTGDGLEAYERDWRRRWHGRALAVVRPADAQQVCRIVQACAQAGVSLVPQGGHTGLVGGGTPDETGTQIVLSLQRLNRVREIDADNLTMTVEAGCVLQSVQAAAADRGLLFPLSLAAEGSCTIGGNLASNAGGTQVLRYGNARELCLGLEVVTAEGELLQGLSGLRKDNTGYDLRDLYIGSEGTLGVITAATLKLVPQPAAVMTALASCASPEQAVRLLRLARTQLGATLTGFELMNAFSRELVARHLPQIAQPLCTAQQVPAWSILLEQSDEQGPQQAQQRLEALLAQALDVGVIDDAVVAMNLA